MSYIYIGQYYDILEREIGITDKKIGITTDLNAREVALNQTKGPIGYTMLRAWDVGTNYKRIEEALHALLDDVNTEGEWFQDENNTLIMRLGRFMEIMGFPPVELALDNERNEIIKEVNSQVDRKELYKRFWLGWVDYVDGRRMFTPQSARAQHWHICSVGVRSCSLNSGITTTQGGSISVYFETRRKGAHQLFEHLFHCMNEIEEKFGEPLEWNHRPDRVSIDVNITLSNTNIRTDSNWLPIYEWMHEKHLKFREVLMPYVREFDWDSDISDGNLLS